jgi:hypothetical protein
MTGVQRLKQVESLGSTHLPNKDAIRSVPESGAKKIGDRNRWERRLLAEGCLRATRFKSQHVRLGQVDLGGFLNDDDPVAFRNMRREGIEQRRLSCPGSARDQDVVLIPDCAGASVDTQNRQLIDTSKPAIN